MSDLEFRRLVLRALALLIQLALPTPTKGYDAEVLTLANELETAARPDAGYQPER